MTYRELLNNMAWIDVLNFLDVCPDKDSCKRCIKYDNNCYICRMAFLNEIVSRETE